MCVFVCLCVCVRVYVYMAHAFTEGQVVEVDNVDPPRVRTTGAPTKEQAAGHGERIRGPKGWVVYWFAQLHSGPLPCLKGHIQLVLHVFGDIPTFIGSYHSLRQLQSWRLTETCAVWWLVAVMRVRFLQPHTRPISHDACSTGMCIGCRGCDIYLPGSTCTAEL